MKWYKKVLSQYTDFKGRARRKEFWMFVLFNVIFSIVATVLDNVLGLTFSPEMPYGYIYIVYGLAVIIPSIAVAVRRLHDMGKSGWWYFIGAVPIIGSIWLIVLLATDSEPGDNKWGPNPKAGE